MSRYTRFAVGLKLTRFASVGVCLIVGGTSVATAAEDDYQLDAFQSDFGGVGLLQTPTARMAPLGEFSFHYDQVDPYTHYAFSLQPFEWMEAGFRYTEISNRLYGPSIAGDRDYLDKGVDLKLRLWGESRFVPQVAMGFRDLGGTGLFGSEYVVANKRWYDFDFSLGLGWGYIGSRGDLGNPLQVFGSRFEERVGERSAGGGDFNVKQVFTGRAGVFGGVQYRTPFKPLTLQLEYDGNDYESEPLNNPQEQDSPINVGARLKVSDYLALSAAWERGNTAMFGATLSLNLANLSQPKSDPPPVPMRAAPERSTDQWQTVSAALASNAGVVPTRISREGNTLVVQGNSTKYRSTPEAELRANRILHNAVSSDITEFAYRWEAGGFVLREDRLPRKPLPEQPLLVEPASTFADDDYRLAVESVSISRDRSAAQTDEPLYELSPSRFSWGFAPGLNQNYGGPDGYLYQLLARVNATYQTDAHGWFSGSLAYTLTDNFDKYDYIADSDLPRVRTFIGEYLKQTDLGIYNLQYTRTARLSDNVFGLAYAGYLEMMYAGAGGEVLYRPFNSPLALGVDAQYVRQRDFDTQFGLRDYETWVGNVSAYIDTGFKDVLAKVSVGRYLAKDVGATLDLSRQFDSGVRIGAYGTFTDAGDDYGEGGFNKGIYISMPLDVFYTKSTRSSATVGWNPLTRDGGQQLSRRFSLYGLTDQRNLGEYWNNYEKLAR